MRCGRGGWLTLVGMLAAGLCAQRAVADPGRDEALRALRDQAGAIQSWVESADRPAWLGANPQYGVGHIERMARLRAHTDLLFIGSSFDGFSISDCIASAKKLATQLT